MNPIIKHHLTLFRDAKRAAMKQPTQTTPHGPPPVRFFSEPARSGGRGCSLPPRPITGKGRIGRSPRGLSDHITRRQDRRQFLLHSSQRGVFLAAERRFLHLDHERA